MRINGMRAVRVHCYLCIHKDTFILKPYSWVPETVVILSLLQSGTSQRAGLLGLWMKLQTANGCLCGSLPLAWAEDSGGLSLQDRMWSKSTPSVYSAWRTVLQGRHGFLREGEQLTTLHLFRAWLTFTAKWKPSLFFHLTVHESLHWHSCAGLNTIWSNTVL